MARSAIQLWGGPECTVNRVGDAFGDQFARCGHTDRVGDLDLFANLGIDAIRYPIPWEKIAPDNAHDCDWSWIDPRIQRLRDLQIDVIAGLVHHGSGPARTSLLDDDGFATGLAEHARRVADRYPWIASYTPVNEPTTTARFSALYGHWYPHARDEAAFWRALLNQVDGVRLSMAAIRTVNPAARLIQTDDLGRTYATAEVRGQATFDNMRRWAGWDLLCGHVTPQHPLWDHIARFGLARRLDAISDAPCPPDVIGVNHYLTSDRFLDHRLRRYPVHLHGGNGRQRYADVEAIRVLEPAPQGLDGALREAWDRYGLPIAVTEVHNGCTREEQMRWIADAWDTAERLRSEAVDVHAITIWSLLGSHGWNTLLTAPGAYESGIFDVRGPQPRATALAELVRSLPDGGARHPLSRGDGWWKRPARLTYPPVYRPARIEARCSARSAGPSPPPLLIAGAATPLGQAFASACTHRNLPHLLLGKCQPDSADIARVLDQHQPWALIDANETTRRIPEIDRHGIPVLHVLSQGSETGAESCSSASSGSALVIRTTDCFAPHAPGSFAHAVATALYRGDRIAAESAQMITPTYIPHLVNTALDLLIDCERGEWQVTGGTTLSRADFARAIARQLGRSEHLIDAASPQYGQREPAPAKKGNVLKLPFQEAIDSFAAAYAQHRMQQSEAA